MSIIVEQRGEPVFEYLRRRAGLSYASLQRNGAANAISRLQRRLNVHDQRELVRHLVRDNDLFDALIADVTIGETHFFRHKAQLDAIRTVILPSLARERSPAHHYRIWSAGCASGEEAYSLAILAEEEGLARRTSILATDISRPALQRARNAEYSSWSFRGLDEKFVGRYFDAVGSIARVRKCLRDRVRFSMLNLALDVYPSEETGTTGLDLVLCRNVLIYFDSKAVAETASRLYACLAPGGWLVMGPSDPPLWHHVPLKPILLPGTVIYQREAKKRDSAPYLRKKPSRIAHQSPSTSLPARTTQRRSVVNKSLSSQTGEQSIYQRILIFAQSDGVAKAEEMAAAQITQNPLATELRYLRSVLLMSLNKDDEAIAELRRLVYLDRSIPAAHFALGTLFHKTRDSQRARRSFTNAYRLATTLPPDETVSMAEGMTAANLASLAKERILELSSNLTDGPN